MIVFREPVNVSTDQGYIDETVNFVFRIISLLLLQFQFQMADIDNRNSRTIHFQAMEANPAIFTVKRNKIN